MGEYSWRATPLWCNFTMFCFLAFLAVAGASDLNRQSIIFNENTPDVFYCPQEKPISIDRMLVKSRPMKKLCDTRAGHFPREPSLIAGTMWTRLSTLARR